MLVGIEATKSGSISRAGVGVHYEEFGSGTRCVLLLPTWSIVHSDIWRYQVPHLARQYRVLTFDGRGNGLSDRPLEPDAYSDREFADDALAVMDALDVEQAAIVSNSQGGTWGLLLAAEHADRIPASVFIAPNVPLAPTLPARAPANAVFDEPLDRYDGWFKFNRHYWATDWPDFLQFFFSNCFTEPDSEAEIAHFVGMGLHTSPEVIVATVEAPGMDLAVASRLASSVRRPALVIHGDSDAITSTHRGIELARLANAELVVLAGSGHEPQCRIPGHVNDLLDHFLAENLSSVGRG
jgi:pimeloyl-ACP methyl ester carboxylesterase